MPIYYKKVNPESSELGLLESGSLGTTNGSSGFFNFSVPKKLSSSRICNYNDVELEKISCSFDDQDQFISQGKNGDDRLTFLESNSSNAADRDHLMTKFGPVVVVKQFPVAKQVSQTPTSINGNGGNIPPVARPVIITYHDIGLNYFSNFESFFSRLSIKQLLQDFRIYHINAPGQEENAEDLSSNYLFPTMDDLSEQLLEVCRYYNIQEFIGFGYGAGANVMSRFALSYGDMVEALFLVNPSATTSTWAEWFYQKLNIRALAIPTTTNPANGGGNQSSASNGDSAASASVDTFQLPQSIQDYFVWHLFGNTELPDRVVDEEAVNFYKRYFAGGSINRQNLMRFIESYIGRSALGISREDRINNFKCPVAVVSADNSPHIDESVKMNGRLDPCNSTWMKLADCSMVLEEQPNKVGQVLRLFLQGLGYTLKKATLLNGAAKSSGIDRDSYLSGKSMPCLADSPGRTCNDGDSMVGFRRAQIYSTNLANEV